MKQEKKRERHKWQQKALHGQYLRHNEGKTTQKTCMWPQSGDMKRETEATLMAAHYQAITTNAVKGKIHKQQGSQIAFACACIGCAKKKRNPSDMHKVSAASSHKPGTRAGTIE